jgi:chromosome segregation ATPase
MNPFRRRRRNRRDMVVLGGWLFADLLLGLAMVFLVANTVGAPPPTPTPSPTPNQLATAEASFAAQQASNDATRAALESDIAMVQATADYRQNRAAVQQVAATQTAAARATEAAMSQSDLATRDAKATEDAVVAQATIAAFSTQAASSDQSQAQLNADLATVSAQATEVAGQIAQQSTQQAEIAAVATEQASSGANSQATIAALQDQNTANQDALATSEAAQASNQSALATAEANQAALEQQQSDLAATATAYVASAPSGSMSQNSIEEKVQVDLQGVLSDDPKAIEDAKQAIRTTFQRYIDAGNCHAGFVILAGRAPDIGSGNQLADKVFSLMVDAVPEVFGDTDTQSESANYTLALPNTQPTGEVVIQVFVYPGCSLLDSGG